MNLATGQNSSNCSEENCTTPVANNYFSHENIYNLCSEEAVNMTRDSNGRFTKGNIPPYAGRYLPSEIKEKISKSHIGKHCSPKTEFKDGYIIPIETRRKMSKSHIGNTNRNGQIPWNKGKPWSIEIKKKISLANKGTLAMENNPSWKGGISFEPYCSKFNRRLKEQIRDRDNRTCQLCGIKENGRKHDVHHVHYDKENCDPDLITLCIRCNRIVNFNRDYYEDLFMNKLKEQGIIKLIVLEEI